MNKALTVCDVRCLVELTVLEKVDVGVVEEKVEVGVVDEEVVVGVKELDDVEVVVGVVEVDVVVSLVLDREEVVVVVSPPLPVVPPPLPSVVVGSVEVAPEPSSVLVGLESDCEKVGNNPPDISKMERVSQ